MIEKYLKDYLNDALSVPAYLERPADCPDSFVIIERTGSLNREKIGGATIAIQSHAPSMYETVCLNEEVLEAMEDAITVNEITSCRLNTSYNFTNPNTKEYRYQAVFELTYY